MYSKGIFYHFKSLFSYKMKFIPTKLEPAFLISNSTITPGKILNILQAFSQRGVFKATLSGMIKTVSQFKASSLIKNQLRPSIVVRSVPQTWLRLLYRCRLSCVLVFLNLVIYILTTDSKGLIYPKIEGHWGYTWNKFIQHPIQAIILSPFLHWNLLHFNFNMVCLIFFTGCLEYLAGTKITASCYLIAMTFSNPLTSILLIPTGLTTPAELDVGASLGIFGCGGALSWFFLKRRWLLVAPLCVITLLQSWDTQHWIIMNHWTAVFFGILVGRILIKT
jgi:membrane associated rhomboid family serine protease